MTNPNKRTNPREDEDTAYWEYIERWVPEAMPKKVKLAPAEVHDIVRYLIVSALGGRSTSEDVAMYKKDPEDGSVIVANRGNMPAKEAFLAISEVIEGYALVTGNSAFENGAVWGSTFNGPVVHIEYCLEKK